MVLESLQDERVEASVRWLYAGAILIFLATIGLGIANVFVDSISRGQILAHLHSGTIGWITLSVLATAVWAFTGSDRVSDAYAGTCKALALAGLIAVIGYVASFGFALTGRAPFWLLPLFGIPTGLVIVSGFVLTLMRSRAVSTLTTPHLLLSGALLVASLGALMGILLGLRFTGTNLFPAVQGGDPLGSHAGPMDMYLVLAFAAFVELILTQDGAERWRWPGLTQTMLGVAAGFVASIALLLGLGPLVPLALLLLLASFAFFAVRIGYRTVLQNPLQGGSSPALFFGGLGFLVYVLLFVYLVATYFSVGETPPHVLSVIFIHTTFVWAGTNLVLAIHSHYAPGDPGRGLEFYGYWVLNVGLFAFFASEAFAARKDGAILMGLGILVALYAVGQRVFASKDPNPPRRAASAP